MRPTRKCFAARRNRRFAQFFQLPGSLISNRELITIEIGDQIGQVFTIRRVDRMKAFAQVGNCLGRKRCQAADQFVGSLGILAGEIGPAGVEAGCTERLRMLVPPGCQVPDESRGIARAGDQAFTVRREELGADITVVSTCPARRNLPLASSNR